MTKYKITLTNVHYYIAQGTIAALNKLLKLHSKEFTLLDTGKTNNGRIIYVKTNLTIKIINSLTSHFTDNYEYLSIQTTEIK